MSPSLDAALARLVQDFGTDRFPIALRQVLEQLCNFDSMVVTRYPDGAAPVSLYHDLDDVQAAITVQFYASGPYLLDPLYLACQGGVDAGAYRLRDLVSEAFYRSEYYRTFYRRVRLSDEMGLLIRSDRGGWIVVSLARQLRRPGFAEQDVARVEGLFQMLSATILKHWDIGGDLLPDQKTEALEDRLQTFGGDVLSPREGEIVRMVLLGHSTPSIAAFLGIAEGTVKVHRHHAYAKLGISSQAELFSLAARHFTAQSG